MNECLEGYRYLLANAEELKIDTARMMIGGDSAGGLLDNKGTFHGYDINFKADITQESATKDQVPVGVILNQLLIPIIKQVKWS